MANTKAPALMLRGGDGDKLEAMARFIAVSRPTMTRRVRRRSPSVARRDGLVSIDRVGQRWSVVVIRRGAGLPWRSGRFTFPTRPCTGAVTRVARAPFMSIWFVRASRVEVFNCTT